MNITIRISSMFKSLASISGGCPIYQDTTNWREKRQKIWVAYTDRKLLLLELSMKEDELIWSSLTNYKGFKT